MNPVESICSHIEQTISRYTGGAICVLGDSPFTRAVKRKATQFSLRILDSPDYIAPMLICRESYHGLLQAPELLDVDYMRMGTMTCCSVAILNVLAVLHAGKGRVAILGRGNAVKGLETVLHDMGIPVETWDRKTDLRPFLDGAAYVVRAAPVEIPLNHNSEYILIDVVGDMRGILQNDRYIGNIGKLTVDIVVLQAVLRSGKWRG